ncbi:hypothetical protein N7507_010263 [Penicillium longicatenatum]|nr:hypothetical protein N7507_010263 [Penicillium longicatenatum]
MSSVIAEKRYFRFTDSLDLQASPSRSHTILSGPHITGTSLLTDALEKKGLSAARRIRYSTKMPEQEVVQEEKINMDK